MVQATPADVRAKRGDGPLAVKFLNAKNELTGKTADDTEQLQIKDKSGKTKNYSVTKLPPMVVRQLAADALKRKFMLGAIGAVKSDPNADVLKSADELYANILAGKIYMRAEGGSKPGRKFDFDLWGDAMFRTSQIKAEANPKVKVFSAKVIADFKVKLEAMPDSERKVFTAKLQNDAVFKRALYEVRAARLKTANGSGEFDALAVI